MGLTQSILMVLYYLPLLNNGLKASGVSSSKLARKIEDAYREAEIYTNPRINVISNKDEEAQKIDAQIVTVGGFVSRPGPVPVYSWHDSF